MAAGLSSPPSSPMWMIGNDNADAMLPSQLLSQEYYWTTPSWELDLSQR
uniref:Uncharacterized protein n=1 Tax=Arundo donax TaxID=35708 RepID=A0A0A9DBY1_ARUDO